jgi:hypothetical protein
MVAEFDTFASSTVTERYQDILFRPYYGYPKAVFMKCQKGSDPLYNEVRGWCD